MKWERIECAFSQISEGHISDAISTLENLEISQKYFTYLVHVNQSKLQYYIIGIKNFMEECTEFPVTQRVCAGIGAIIGGFEAALLQHFCASPVPEEYMLKLKKFASSYIQLEEYRHTASAIPAQYFIITMTDERTCEVCKSFEGKKFSIEQAVIGKNFPPFEHCNSKFCRCTTGFEMKARGE